MQTLSPSLALASSYVQLLSLPILSAVSFYFSKRENSKKVRLFCFFLKLYQSSSPSEFGSGQSSSSSEFGSGQSSSSSEFGSEFGSGKSSSSSGFGSGKPGEPVRLSVRCAIQSL
jgi:hypothetical protein